MGLQLSLRPLARSALSGLRLPRPRTAAGWVVLLTYTGCLGLLLVFIHELVGSEENQPRALMTEQFSLPEERVWD